MTESGDAPVGASQTMMTWRSTGMNVRRDEDHSCSQIGCRTPRSDTRMGIHSDGVGCHAPVDADVMMVASEWHRDERPLRRCC